MTDINKLNLGLNISIWVLYESKIEVLMFHRSLGGSTNAGHKLACLIYIFTFFHLKKIVPTSLVLYFQFCEFNGNFF